MFKLDEQRIQEALFNFVRSGQDIVLPNISWSYLHSEADLVKITPAGYLYEYEIKISLSDFTNDFKKRKHIFYNKNIYGLGRGHPNYFIYVAPLKAIPLCIPDYAGLYEILQQGSYMFFREIIKPKKLHTYKISDDERVKMLRVLMFRYWKMSSQLSKAKIQKELFAKGLSN